MKFNIGDAVDYKNGDRGGIYGGKIREVTDIVCGEQHYKVEFFEEPPTLFPISEKHLTHSVA